MRGNTQVNDSQQQDKVALLTEEWIRRINFLLKWLIFIRPLSRRGGVLSMRQWYLRSNKFDRLPIGKTVPVSIILFSQTVVNANINNVGYAKGAPALCGICEKTEVCAEDFRLQEWSDCNQINWGMMYECVAMNAPSQSLLHRSWIDSMMVAYFACAITSRFLRRKAGQIHNSDKLMAFMQMKLV